jgi:hypothetical protein
MMEMQTPAHRPVLYGSLALLGAGAALFLLFSGTRPRAGSPAGAAAAAPLSDRALPASRAELLDLAFEAATALPVNPHVKSRSRAQDAVVAACLELDQPLRARRFIERIDNWRRGAGWADLAFYCAQKGRTGDVARYLELARRVSEEAALDPDAQAWRRDRILAKVARTHAWLGDADRARELEQGLEESERGAVQAARALRLEPADYQGQLDALGQAVSTGNFERIRNQLESCARLYDRAYADAGWRVRLEQRLRTACAQLPLTIRVDVLAKLAGSAADHEDRANARALVGEARALLEAGPGTPEDRIAVACRLARLRHRAGEPDAARREVDAARALYDAGRDRIDGMHRAGALRALAEAGHALGDAEAARAAWARAVEEGAANPNARPRAEELSATCCSMALAGFEPDASLRSRLFEIQRGLSSPW